MINGAHVIVYSRDAEADRRFFRDVLQFPHVDAGHGWLIFALPSSEVAVHPADPGGSHELFLMCDDIRVEIAKLDARQVPHTDIDEQRWGSIIRLSLPGGGQLGVYQPKHPRPPSTSGG
jgi:catechol 2,3-dioxygenase-like lactoylglutathione lyase family enzyme